MQDYTKAFIHEGMILEACSYKERSASTIVINTQTLSKYLYIHVPSECTHLDLLRVMKLAKPEDVTSDDDSDDMKSDDIVKYMHHPWVRIKCSILDWTPGKHVYKLSFGIPHEVSPEYLDYYISYVSQEDNPEKLYVYMKR